MRMIRRVAAQPLGVLAGFVAASAMFLVAFGFAFAGGMALAAHDESGITHTCVNQFTGQARFVRPGQAPNCNGNELLVDLAGGAVVGELAAIGARVDDLEARTVEQAQQIEEIEGETAQQAQQIDALETTTAALQDELVEQDGHIDELETAVTSDGE